MSSDPRNEYLPPQGTHGARGHVAGEPRAFGLMRPLPSSTANLAEWVQVDPVPVLVVGSGGFLLDANSAGHQVVEAGAAVSLRGQTLAFTDNQAQQSFLRALGTVISRRALAKAIVLRGNDGGWRRLDVRACTGGGDWAFVRVVAEPQGTVDIDPIMQAFALSPSEGEVLRRLTEGLSPKEIARALSISTNTVRAHLRMLYLKMNVRGIPGVIRQAVRLTR
jgi:DNA-binding CsgD family transcriptional regulator